MIENYFKEKNIKLTKQRKMVFEVIEKLEEAKLKDIQKLCNEKVDNSTIYRIIDLFLEKGIVEKNIDSYNNIVYSINKKQIMSREILANKIWGYDSEAEYNNVEVYVSFLRRTLKLLKSNVKIQAVRGIGYKLEVEDD